jgi:hypothetical protein
MVSTIVSNDDNFMKLANQAMKKISGFLKEGKHEQSEINEIKISVSVLSAWTRHEQTLSNERGSMLSFARLLTDDKRRLAQYIQETMPHTGIYKLLPENLVTPLENDVTRLTAEKEKLAKDNIELKEQVVELLQSK